MVQTLEVAKQRLDELKGDVSFTHHTHGVLSGKAVFGEVTHLVQVLLCRGEVGQVMHEASMKSLSLLFNTSVLKKSH